MVELVIPVYNEASELEQNLLKLAQFLNSNLQCQWRVVIVDNGSTDLTPTIGKRLSQQVPNVGYMRLEEKGRGRALRTAWLESTADILGYMDVDLSTDLGALPIMLEAVSKQGFHIAAGSRLLKPEMVERGFKREFISRGYNVLVKLLFQTHFSDAQCGFKLLKSETAQTLLQLTKADGWFLDTELLVLAEKLGMNIFDFPVRWVDDSDSRVRIVATAIEDIRGMLELKKTLKSEPFQQHLVGVTQRIEMPS